MASYYIDGSSNITGAVQSGTFTAGEWLMQGTSTARAKLVGTVTGSNDMVVTGIVGVPTGAGDGSDDWTGLTSGAVYRPTAAPSANGSDLAAGGDSTPWATVDHAKAVGGSNTIYGKRGSIWFDDHWISASGTDDANRFCWDAYGDSSLPLPAIYCAIPIPTGSLWSLVGGTSDVYQTAFPGASYNVAAIWATNYATVWYGSIGYYLWRGENGVAKAGPDTAWCDATSGTCFYAADVLYIHAPAGIDPTVAGNILWASVYNRGIFTGSSGGAGTGYNYITVRNWDARYTAFGAYGTGANNYNEAGSNITIENCEVNYATATGFCAQGVDILVQNNTINYCAERSLCSICYATTLPKPNNVIFQDNTVNDIVPLAGGNQWTVNYGATAIGSDCSIGGAGDSTNVQFLRTIVNCGGNRLFATTGDDSGHIVDGIEVVGAGVWDRNIYVSNSINLTIKNINNPNACTNANYATGAGCTGLKILDNKFKVIDGKYGLNFNATGGAPFVGYNEITQSGTGATGAGIFTNCAVKIYNNEFKGTGLYGIRFDADVAVDIKNNKFTGMTNNIRCPAAYTNMLTDYNYSATYTNWGNVNGAGKSLAQWQALRADIDLNSSITAYKMNGLKTVWNTIADIVDLNGYQITDGSGTVTVPWLSIGAIQFVVGSNLGLGLNVSSGNKIPPRRRRR